LVIKDGVLCLVHRKWRKKEGRNKQQRAFSGFITTPLC